MNIHIEKIVYPGKSLGRGDNGITTFVDGALPGEEIEIQIIKQKKSFIEGKLVQVIHPSPKRCEPRCSSFGRCGGCSFQHTHYENQLLIKQEYVQELFSHISSLPVQKILPSPQSWEYRNKMEFSFANYNNEIIIGLHEKGQFNKFFPIPPCFIADKDFLQLVDIITQFARSSSLPVYDKKTHEGFWRHLVVRKARRTGETLVNIITNRDTSIDSSFWNPLLKELSSLTSIYWTMNEQWADAVIADEVIHLSGKPFIEEQMIINKKTYYFHISPFSFFQTNTEGAEILYETVINTLQPQSNDILLDLYCGTGTIGITIAPFVKEVLGVEQIPSAIDNANTNKELNHINNISFEVGSVEKWIKHGSIPSYNNLILDPPRSGISNKVIDFIQKTTPEKIVYVSCNPSTQVRDIELLQKQAGYTLQTIIPIDMFPQTYHVEVVTLLTKN